MKKVQYYNVIQNKCNKVSSNWPPAYQSLLFGISSFSSIILWGLECTEYDFPTPNCDYVYHGEDHPHQYIVVGL